jgi:hypothetical protein
VRPTDPEKIDRDYSTVSGQRISLPQMGPQDPKEVTRDTARDLSALGGKLAGEGKTMG